MFDLKIYVELTHHLSKKQITGITGLQRIGKSTALKYLLKQATSLYADFVWGGRVVGLKNRI